MKKARIETTLPNVATGATLTDEIVVPPFPNCTLRQVSIGSASESFDIRINEIPGEDINGHRKLFEVLRINLRTIYRLAVDISHVKDDPGASALYITITNNDTVNATGEQRLSLWFEENEVAKT